MACVPTLIPGDKPTDLSPFMYTPLGPSQHTRLLRLEPSIDPGAPLRCSLLAVDLDTYPDYEAISYVWGSPELTDSLVVEQSGSLYRLKITPNLHQGLQRLRTAVAPRYLWVDAVCIDQSDENDKSHQIPRMAQIYRQANNVVVWLGEHPAEAECLARLSKAVTRPHDELQLAEVRKDCVGLYSLPWFRRRWIIQEAVLNDDAIILCGDSNTSLTRLIHAFTKFEHGFPMIQKIAELRRGRIWNQKIDNDIMTLLESFDETECSNDLDRVYAIAGLSGDVAPVPKNDQRQEHHSPIPPYIYLPVNYEQDARSLYGSFAKTMVKTFGASSSIFIQILVSASTRLQSLQHDTSWFPCWNMPVVRQPLQTPNKVFSQSALADSLCAGSLYQTVSFGGNFFNPITGFTPGEKGRRISDVSMPFPAVCTASELCTWIQLVFRDIMKWAQAARAEERYNPWVSTDKALLSTLFAFMVDWNISRQYVESYVPDEPCFKIFKSICMGTESITESDLTQRPVREIVRTMRGRRVVKWDSYFIKCSEARGDTGPQNARLADTDLNNLGRSLHKGQLFYRPTASFPIGIAPDFSNINDELMLGPREPLDDGPYEWLENSNFGCSLRRGFVLRLSHEQCDSGHNRVPHYNFIGECAVACDGGLEDEENERDRYLMTKPYPKYDMCLH